MMNKSAVGIFRVPLSFYITYFESLSYRTNTFTKTLAAAFNGRVGAICTVVGLPTMVRVRCPDLPNYMVYITTCVTP